MFCVDHPFFFAFLFVLRLLWYLHSTAKPVARFVDFSRLHRIYQCLIWDYCAFCDAPFTISCRKLRLIMIMLSLCNSYLLLLSVNYKAVCGYHKLFLCSYNALWMTLLVVADRFFVRSSFQWSCSVIYRSSLFMRIKINHFAFSNGAFVCFFFQRKQKTLYTERERTALYGFVFNTHLSTWFVQTITGCWLLSWLSRTCSTTCAQTNVPDRRCICTNRIHDRSCSDWVTDVLMRTEISSTPGQRRNKMKKETKHKITV